MMKDLDFDELDQAVNSLMVGIPKGPAPDDDAAKEKMLTIKPTLSDSERPSFTTLEQTAAKAGVEIESIATSAPANPLAARRTSGRFMDVVHPSSDMKINNRPVVSREGLQLNPIAPRPVTTPQPSIELPVADVVADQTPEVIEQPKQANDWPDPLDMQVAAQEEPITQPSVAEVEEVVAPELVMAAPVATPAVEEQAPLQTPFLVDTKVEKRPLGAFATDLHSTVDDVPIEQPSSAPSLNDQLEADSPKQSDVATDLPDELQHDLIKIESDNDTPKEVVEESKAPSFTPPVVTPAPAVVNGPVSIQPQYKEELSTAPTEHAAIYDTESYHKPLAHPAKKKSGWLWVIWIILLLALGAGGAAALYYFKII